MTSATFTDDALRNAVLVVAHPDDEVLWFGSIAAKVGRIVVCYRDDPGNPDLAHGRDRTIANHPWAERITSLDLTETGAFGFADWPSPAENRNGLELNAPAAVRRNYRRSASALRKRLSPIIADAQQVITHNPWGEYGHEEHVLVHRAVVSVCREASIPVWYDNYVSNWSERLAANALADPQGDIVSAGIDPDVCASVADVYRQFDAWTWFDDFRWFREESFIRHEDRVRRQGRTLALNFIRLPERRSKRPARGGLLRRIRRGLRPNQNTVTREHE